MSINSVGRGGSIQLNTGNTTVRQSPRSDFGSHMRTGIQVGANTTAGAIGVAAPFAPGAAVVSAAVAGAGNAMAGGGGAGGAGMMGQAGGSVTSGDIPTAGNFLGGQGPNGQPGQQGGVQGDLMSETKNMQEMMASFNLQYLQLQQKMQNENRTFTTVSNVMKTKHDTAKASINNVR